MKKKILAFSLILSLSVSGISTLAAKPESQREMQEYTEDYEAEGEISDTEKVEKKTEEAEGIEEASEKADSKENANKETEETEKTEEAIKSNM